METEFKYLLLCIITQTHSTNLKILKVESCSSQSSCESALPENRGTEETWATTAATETRSIGEYPGASQCQYNPDPKISVPFRFGLLHVLPVLHVQHIRMVNDAHFHGGKEIEVPLPDQMKSSTLIHFGLHQFHFTFTLLTTFSHHPPVLLPSFSLAPSFPSFFNDSLALLCLSPSAPVNAALELNHGHFTAPRTYQASANLPGCSFAALPDIQHSRNIPHDYPLKIQKLLPCISSHRVTNI